MSGRTIVVMTMMKEDSDPKVSEPHFMIALRRMRTTVPVTAMEITVSHAVAIVPARDKKEAINPVRVTSLVRAATSLVKDKVVTSLVKAAISARDRKVAISLAKDKVVISHVRAAISVRVRKVAISLVKDRVASSLVRVVMESPIRSLMVSPAALTRKVPVSIRPTMIRMPNIA